ncbi:hypothetical protein [Pseudobacter ginsenosidimutans]|nr:hypothetical protein [Pseudobacter ginsenosidimutans]QEC40849.1 hypothetical protein FSB84_03735 [Pseudobacter ginsenosidimutans]
MNDLRYGSLTNPKFIDSILVTANNRKPVQIRVKRNSSDKQNENWAYLDTILHRNNFPSSQPDTLDIKEQQFFRTPPGFLSTAAPQKSEVKLFLPKGESEKANYGSNVLKVVMLPKNDLYAYNNKKLKEGKRYTYKQLQSLLSSRKSEKDFFVLVKPTKQTTYESTVAMLDLLGGEEIRNYKLVDPTKEEEDFTKILLNNNSK